MDGPKGSVKQRIKDSEPIDEGWTNRVYETPESTIIKVFSTHILEALIFGTADILHGKPNIPFRSERLQKEVEMKKSLSEQGYAVPEILAVYQNAVEIEKVGDKSLAEIIEEKELEEVRDAGRKTGELISGLHADNYSLGDATFQNFYIDGDKIYTIDHEYSSMNSDWIDLERDAIHILSDSLEYGDEKHKAFTNGFETTFREFKTSERFLAIFFSMFTSILGLQPRRLKNTVSNSVKSL